MNNILFRWIFRRFSWVAVVGAILLPAGCGSGYNFPSGPVTASKENEEPPPPPPIKSKPGLPPPALAPQRMILTMPVRFNRKLPPTV